ncbi:MAG: ERF family protein [Fimbriiglobus sp.]
MSDEFVDDDGKQPTPPAPPVGQTVQVANRRPVQQPDNPTPELIAAVVKAMGEMPRIEESGKDSSGKGLPYKFLSEKEIIPAVKGILFANGLILVPFRQYEVAERYVGKMTTRLIRATYRLCHSGGGWMFVETMGEGFDAGDKSVYKAMTGAFKYALRETFMLSGGHDPDDTPSPGVHQPQQPAKFDPKTLPFEYRFRLSRDAISTSDTAEKLTKMIDAARQVKFNPDQLAELEACHQKRAAELAAAHPTDAGSESIPFEDPNEPSL